MRRTSLTKFEAETAYQELLKALELVGGSQTALARLCGEPIKQQHVRNWLYRDKRIAADYAQVLELKLNGEVKSYRLRPDIFKLQFLESIPAQH